MKKKTKLMKNKKEFGEEQKEKKKRTNCRKHQEKNEHEWKSKKNTPQKKGKIKLIKTNK